MSHHLSTVPIESASDRAVVVTQAPPDNPGRSAAGPAAADPSPVADAAPAAATGAAPSAAPAAPTAGGTSGLAGANIPVENVAAASTQIRAAQTDLGTTSTAPRRLDGLDGIGGGGGGGGADGGGAAGEEQVAQGTANQDVSQAGLGGQVTDQQLSNEAITIDAATDGGGADAGVGADPTLSTQGR